MKKYIIMKMTGKGTKKSRSAVVMDLSTKRKYHVSGNIPEFRNGMIVDLEIKNNEVIDYNIPLSDRNYNCLTKAKINPDEYMDMIEKHKQLKKIGIGWNVIIRGPEAIYSILPFNKADIIHKTMINNPLDSVRLNAINNQLITFERQNIRKIEYAISDYLTVFDNIEKTGAYPELTVTQKLNCLKDAKYSYDNGKIHDVELQKKEDYILSDINSRKLLSQPLLQTNQIKEYLNDLKETHSTLEEEQKKILWCLTNTLPCIVTGGAGTGKSFVVKAIIECYSKYKDSDSILLVSPTGKAARNLEEKTGMTANTIHKALRKNPDSEYVFFTKENPLPYKLIVIDESSMIDTELMYDLLSATESITKIIFVGDHNQLAPVGYGEPFFNFREILDTYYLQKNHRQAEGTDILSNAIAVLNNQPLFEGKGISINKVKSIEITDIKNILQSYDNNTQIMTPYNKLNNRINFYLKLGTDDYYPGDKIITLRNTKDYCNGDIGYISNVFEDGSIEIKFDENRYVTVDYKNRLDIGLAYALTVHKMQGSEAPRIICFLPDNKFISKSLLYTAVTRAKQKLEIYYYHDIEVNNDNSYEKM